MKNHSLSVILPGNSFSLRALLGIAIVSFAINMASAAVGTQLEYFFYNDGTQVISDNGEPDDAVLNRLYDTQHNGIEWQLMTQHLTPGVWYDVWLEGSDDNFENITFSWWLGRARATPQGDLNVTGNVYVGAPRGPHTGWFTNSRARANLLIRTTGGITLQTVSFPAF